MCSSTVVFAVVRFFALAIDVKTVILGPEVLEYCVVDLEASSVACCFCPIAIPRRYRLWFVPDICFQGFLVFVKDSVDAIEGI